MLPKISISDSRNSLSLVVWMLLLWFPALVFFCTSLMAACTSSGIRFRMAGRWVERMAQFVQPPLLVLLLFIW